MLTNSAKLNCCPGVSNPAMKPPAPGVDIIEDGRACVFEGGVEGAKILGFAPGFAGEGDVAKYSSRSAPSSAFALPLRFRAAEDRDGGGVRGGEAWKREVFMLNE